nr:HNH endonuclease signature motif containing protein [Acetobacter lambici]
MCEFNKKLSEQIVLLKKSDHSVLESDGRLPRCTFFPKWIWNRILHRDRGQCQNCGRMTIAVYDSAETPHIDHMVPLASGGGNDPTNLQLLCAACNLAKGPKLVDIRDEYSWPDSRG